MKKWNAVLLAILAFAISAKSFASFELGARYFNEENYEKAYGEFLLSATYGDVQAQYNIGAMYFQGQHLEKDWVKAYAWFYLSESGNEAVENSVAEKIWQRLSKEQRAEALNLREELIGRYGKEAVLDSLSPELTMRNVDNKSYQSIRKVVPDYPRSLERAGRSGWVDLIYTIAEDGSTRDHAVFYTSAKGFEKQALKAVKQWQYKPREVDGVAVPTPGVFARINFKSYNESSKHKIQNFLSKQKKEADTGGANEQYSYAYTLYATKSLVARDWSDESGHYDIELLNDSSTRWYEKAAAQGHSSAAYFLGMNTMRGQYCEKDTFKSAGWLYRAAMFGNAEAKYTLALEYLNGAMLGKDVTKGLFWLEQAASSLDAARLRYAWYLAVVSDESIRDVNKAQQYLADIPEDYVDQLTVYEVSAAVAAQAGEFSKAVEWQQDALSLAEDYELELEPYSARLELYKNNQGYNIDV